ncbi:MAG: tyrosine-type recombinase/integrase [Anaerolineae bacterium]
MEQSAQQLDLLAQDRVPSPAPQAPQLPTAQSDLRAANDWFATYLQSHRYSANTVAGYTAAVESLARHYGRPVILGHVKERHLLRYVRWLTLQGTHVPPTTVATRITGLRRFFRALVECGILSIDPAANLRPPREPRRLPLSLDEDEVVALRQEAWRQFAEDQEAGSLPLFVLLLMLDLGLRRSEIEALTAEHVVPRQGGYELVIRHPRRSHRYQNRTLQAPAEFAAVYHAFRAHHPPRDTFLVATPRRSLYRVIARLGKQAGLRSLLTPSALRWTCARHWYATQSPDETQRRLGLSPIGWQHAVEVLGGMEQERGVRSQE